MGASERQREVSDRDQQARFRFSVIGPLLAAPPARGELQQALHELAAREYQHPLSKQPIALGVSTIERWYYRARLSPDPVGALRNQVRSDAGGHPSVSAAQRVVLRQQHREHPGWSYQLHHDNLKVLAEQQAELGRVPSYAVVRRWMKTQGLYRRKRTRVRHTAGARRAACRLEQREVRSYEAEYVGGLFHADFHHASREVLTRQGQWVRPQLLAILDDKSRLCCHAQWYLQEDAETFVHGLLQGFLKRGLSRALMTDNGGAETAAEIEEGLAEVGVLHELTLPYSPYQNAKQEVFWVPIETRLLAMLEGVPDLTLEQLNEATQAWIELEYHRRVHSETGQTPLEAFLAGPNVLRDCPAPQQLRHAFRVKVVRMQRRSDGTLTLDGVRFELPGRLHHLTRVAVRYARWDLSQAAVVDARTGAEVAAIYPVNKVNNASGQRRHRDRRCGRARGAGRSCTTVAEAACRVRGHRPATGLPPQTREPQGGQGGDPMNRKLLALYGLKFNPFAPELPTEALWIAPEVENFLWRIQFALVREGGFALITGESGSGKSVTLRLLSERLAAEPDLVVGAISRPQANVADFYRELGELFGVPLRPHNRWGGAKALRERWTLHLDTTLLRPLLLVDEAQELTPPVAAELRLLSSTRFDSRQLLSVVLAGDLRLQDKLRHQDLVPLGNRLRTRLALQPASVEQLQDALKHLLNAAGNSALMTSELIVTRCEHALGNYRVLLTTAAELLLAAAQNELSQIDEKLYFELFSPATPPSGSRRPR